MEHTDEAILLGSLSRAPIVSYRALVCVHVFILFIYLFFSSRAQSCLHDLQPRRITDWERIRLEHGAPWQPCGNLLSVLSLALSQIYCHSISDTPNKGTRPAIPCLFVKSPHLWGSQLEINFRLEWLARNKSFPLSFFFFFFFPPLPHLFCSFTVWGNGGASCKGAFSSHETERWKLW